MPCRGWSYLDIFGNALPDQQLRVGQSPIYVLDPEAGLLLKAAEHSAAAAKDFTLRALAKTDTDPAVLTALRKVAPGDGAALVSCRRTFCRAEITAARCRSVFIWYRGLLLRFKLA
jgi:hypothetical protein